MIFPLTQPHSANSARDLWRTPIRRQVPVAVPAEDPSGSRPGNCPGLRGPPPVTLLTSSAGSRRQLLDAAGRVLGVARSSATMEWPVAAKAEAWDQAP